MADRVDSTPDARTVYLWEVEPCMEDGRGTSGWTVTVVSMTPDLSDLPRIVRVALDSKFRDGYSPGYAAEWTGIKRAELRGTATLDPRLDGFPELLEVRSHRPIHAGATGTVEQHLADGIRVVADTWNSASDGTLVKRDEP